MPYEDVIKCVSCGCEKSERRKIEWGLSQKKEVFRQYKRGARLRNYNFDLSLDEFVRLCEQDCFYCGSLPSNKRKNRSGNGDFTYNGIDRVDNEKGYTLDNCVPCCKRCNRLKMDLSQSFFFDHIVKIVEKCKLMVSS
jgi:hypothetical protein